jgi:hypothetical protein
MSNEVMMTDGANEMSVAKTKSPMDLIAIAVEKGVSDVGVMEKLVKLAERMQENLARQNFNQAIAEFKKRCPIIKKDKASSTTTRSGAQFKINYASPEQIAATIDPILVDCGLSYRWSSDENETHIKSICIVSHKDGHSERSEYAIIKPAIQDMQRNHFAHPAALGRAKRHSLIMALGLITAEEPDKFENIETETINIEQVREIKDLIVSADANLKVFLEFIGEESVEKIRASSYGIAKNSLLQKIKNKSE